MLFQLGLEVFEQRKGICRATCKTGENLFVVEPPHLARAGLYDDIAQRDLAVAAQRNNIAAPHGQDGSAAILLHALPSVKESRNSTLQKSRRWRDATIPGRISGGYLYYLATPPEFYMDIATQLGALGLADQTENSAWRRIILEKPSGHDLASARALDAHLLQIFTEEQIYRIDHYLGKETVQNILAFRFANAIFEPLWNRHYVDYIEITAAEQIGVEDRGGYYAHAGALRDMVQNHLLQIVATIAMDPPLTFTTDSVRNEKAKVFQALSPIKPADIAKQVIRGQYVESTIRGEKVRDTAAKQTWIRNRALRLS